MTEIHPTGEALRRLDPESKERRLKRGMRNRCHLAHFCAEDSRNIPRPCTNGPNRGCPVWAVPPLRHPAAWSLLIILQVDVVYAHFAGLNAIHYLLKVWVFDLQSVTD